jgi:hypothetical protein
MTVVQSVEEIVFQLWKIIYCILIKIYFYKKKKKRREKENNILQKKFFFISIYLSKHKNLNSFNSKMNKY